VLFRGSVGKSRAAVAVCGGHGFNVFFCKFLSVVGKYVPKNDGLKFGGCVSLIRGGWCFLLELFTFQVFGFMTRVGSTVPLLMNRFAKCYQPRCRVLGFGLEFGFGSSERKGLRRVV